MLRLALSETNVPARAVLSAPAFATIATGTGFGVVPGFEAVVEPVASSVGAGGVTVELVGGAQAATEGAVAPGQGLSCPKTWPSISPKPFLRGPMLENSKAGGVPPGVTSSGKIHSLTGCRYVPAFIPSPVVIAVSPILIR